MTESEAKYVEDFLRRFDLPGVAAAVDPTVPTGEWRIYDHPGHEVRRDVTASALQDVIDRLDPPRPDRCPAPRGPADAVPGRPSKEPGRLTEPPLGGAVYLPERARSPEAADRAG